MYLRIHYRRRTILKTSKKVYEVMFFDYLNVLKVCSIHYILRSDTNVKKKILFDKINGTKNAVFFFRELQLITVLILIFGSYMN